MSVQPQVPTSRHSLRSGFHRHWEALAAEERSQMVLGRRLLLLTTISRTVVFWGPAYAVFFTVLGLPYSALGTVVAGLLIGLGPRLVRDSTAAANLFTASVGCSVVVVAWESGGISSPTVPWLAVLPIAGFALCGRRSGVAWTAAAIGAVALFRGADTAEAFSVTPLDPDTMEWFRLGTWSGLIGVIATYAFAFETYNNQTLRGLEETNQELAQARDDAIASGQSKERFLANMSHEIRTPMNGVIGMAELLSRSNLDETQRECTAGIRSSARTLLRVIGDVLDFSKIQSGALEIQTSPFDLAALVRENTDLLQPVALDAGIDLEADFDAAVPRWLIGDPVRLTQIQSNLVGNALKFTKDGLVRVRVSLESSTEHTANVLFEVEDTGIGISEDQLPRIFEHFTQADTSTTRRYEGTGLGLAIAREIAELMGGEMGVRSRVGEGSCFWFRLAFDLAEAPATRGADVAAEPASVAPGSQIGSEILLVEDNRVNQELAIAILEQAGYRVVLAEDGEQAVAAAETKAFDAILMDCQMPILDGFEATRAIRTGTGANAGTPIIALTANAIDGDRERCLEAGMSDYLAKPIEVDGLLAKVRTAVGAIPQRRT